MTYIRALFLAEVLRRADLEVKEMPGWKTRGRPPSVGGFDPRALMFHHDASAKGPTPSEAHFIAKVGHRSKNPKKDVPPPLAQCWVDTDGVWHVLAAGRCNHAGVGKGFGRIPKNSGNTFAIGIETDHTSGEDWFPGQQESIVRGFAALADAMSIKPEQSICGHKEYAPDRKVDPKPMDMDSFRKDVEQLLGSVRGSRGAPQPRSEPTLNTVVDLADLQEAARLDPPAAQGHTTHKKAVLVVERALEAEGLLPSERVDGSFGTVTIGAYKRFQESLGFSGSAADGVPGAVSLTKLGREHGFRVNR
jgi:N-acetylmuramoyl-L-alanine amidase